MISKNLKYSVLGDKCVKMNKTTSVTFKKSCFNLRHKDLRSIHNLKDQMWPVVLISMRAQNKVSPRYKDTKAVSFTVTISTQNYLSISAPISYYGREKEFPNKVCKHLSLGKMLFYLGCASTRKHVSSSSVPHMCNHMCSC